MNWRGVVLPSVAAVTIVTAACDKDPTRSVPSFTLACPTGTLNVNAPIALQFNQPVLASTITGGNIVLTDVESGVEVPGSLVLDPASGNIVNFVPSDPLPFQRELRLRVQNLLTAEGSTAIGVTVCELMTQLPPITELFWESVPTATGNRLLGATQYAPDQGFVASAGGPIFVRGEGDFQVALHDPHFSSSLDVSAVSASRFFSAHIDIRSSRFVLVETDDAGATYTERLSTGFAITRLLFRPITGSANLFGVAGGGTAVQGTFFKWEPATSTLTTEIEANTGNVQDIAFRSNLQNGVAVTAGVELPSITTFGRVYASADSGRSWNEINVPAGGSAAPPEVLFYRGVAHRSNGEIFAVGGNGAVYRFDRQGDGSYVRVTVDVDPTLESIEPDNPQALAFTDIEFSQTDDQLGWLVGQQLINMTGGVPQFHGLIYETNDGGRTWTRQGVIDAPDFGAAFPALNRIHAFSSTSIWIVGDGGVVLRYSPQP